MNNNQLIQLGGFGEIADFGHNYRQGNRVYSSEGLAATLSAQPLGNRGGYSSLYLIPTPQYMIKEN